MTPFTHGAGLLAAAFIDHGAAVVLLDGVELAAVERLLEGGTIDHVFAPPTVLAKLAAAFPDRHFPGIRIVFCGTAPLTPNLYAKARALFGPVVRITYGKPEVVNPIAVLPPAACELYYGEADPGAGFCVGWPGSGVESARRRGGGDPRQVQAAARLCRARDPAAQRAGQGATRGGARNACRAL